VGQFNAVAAEDPPALAQAAPDQRHAGQGGGVVPGGCFDRAFHSENIIGRSPAKVKDKIKFCANNNF
jgi:hypothetical protein